MLVATLIPPTFHLSLFLFLKLRIIINTLFSYKYSSRSFLTLLQRLFSFPLLTPPSSCQFLVSLFLQPHWILILALINVLGIYGKATLTHSYLKDGSLTPWLAWHTLRAWMSRRRVQLFPDAFPSQCNAPDGTRRWCCGSTFLHPHPARRVVFQEARWNVKS